ncbi:MAG: hypothetical protein KAI79_06465 [Bacteroidales bacterium]|nr:hypothetical protein [Bacteroidales bacterium]
MLEINKAIFISILSMLKMSKKEKISIEIVTQINNLIEQTKSELILTDSPKELKGLGKSVDFLFKKNGFSKKPIAQVSDICEKKNGKLEHFFFENNLNKFIIIDSDNIKCFKARFLHCKKEGSLSKEHYSTALALLN